MVTQTSAQPCIIYVAITGSVPRKRDNPALPVTITEQVESTHEAYEAGAALVHVHVRDGLRSLIHVEAGHMHLPAPPVLDGIGFVEFAVDHRSRQALALCLEQLGFRNSGHHRTKDVEL